MEKLKVLLQGFEKGNMYIAVLSDGVNELNHLKLKQKYVFGERVVLDEELFEKTILEKGHLGDLFINESGLFDLIPSNDLYVLVGERFEYSCGYEIENGENVACYFSSINQYGSSGKNGKLENYAKNFSLKNKDNFSKENIYFINGYRKRFTNSEIIECSKVSDDEFNSFKKLFIKNLN